MKTSIQKQTSYFGILTKKKLLSYDSVKIKLEDKIINGCGFYSDHNFENYKIFNISGVIDIESD